MILTSTEYWKCSCCLLFLLMYLGFSIKPVQAQHQIFEAPTDSCFHNHNEYDTKVYSRYGTMLQGKLSTNSLPEPSSNFVITYGPEFSEEAREALDYAAYIWSTVLVSDVDIRVQAEFSSMGGSLLAQGRNLSLHRGFANAPDPETIFPDALADAIAGVDLNPNGSADIFITFNSNIDWYYGTDLNTSGKFDFVTLALHELAHGLGFMGNAFYSSSSGTASILPYTLFQTMADNAGTLLSDYPGGSVELGNAVTSNAVYLTGINSSTANNNKWPKVYAPGTYISGSSLSHLDESTYRPGNANSLMSPSFGKGEAVHDISPMIRGILKDMGWQINEEIPTEPEPEPDPITYLPDVSPADPQAGLQYHLYTDTSEEIPDFSNFTAADSGIVQSFEAFTSQLPEQFGLKLAGFFQVPTQGTYTLYVQGADALQLFVHGEQVINFSGSSAESLDSAVLHLEAGYHPFFTYFLRRAPGIQFTSQMKNPDGQINAIPQEYLFYDAGTAAPQTTAHSLAQGIKYAYYEGSWQSLPDFSSLRPVETGLIDNFSLLPRHQEKDYAFVYQGFINAPANGSYHFFLNSSDGSRLYINDSLIVDNDGIHSIQEAEGTLELSQGTHAVRIEFFNASNGGTLSAEMKLAGFERRNISSAELFHNALNPEVASLGAMIKTEFTDAVLFPNPSQGEVVLEFNAPDNQAKVTVHDAMGYLVYESSALVSGTDIGLSHLPPGMYIVDVRAAGQSKKFKLMLE